MSDEHACDQSCPLARREFLGAAALTALALLEAACGNGQIGPTVPGDAGVVGGNTLVVTLSQYSALASTGGVARVDGGNGRPVALVRTSATTFLALSLRCPHEGFTVGVTGSTFYCPAHGARFSNNGTWTGGQRTSSLVSLASTYDAVTGKVTISV
jgi:cytochrome b6-f complex iron-sulfur subunit